jgi:hypothetical protein
LIACEGGKAAGVIEQVTNRNGRRRSLIGEAELWQLVLYRPIEINLPGADELLNCQGGKGFGDGGKHERRLGRDRVAIHIRRAISLDIENSILFHDPYCKTGDRQAAHCLLDVGIHFVSESLGGWMRQDRCGCDTRNQTQGDQERKMQNGFDFVSCTILWAIYVPMAFKQFLTQHSRCIVPSMQAF